jgi:hypothetical protein
VLIPNPEELMNIPTPTTPHAFLITPVMVHDPGKGDLIDLELPDGTFLRAQAAPDVLRLAFDFTGLWKATLHFDTHPTARLKEPLYLPRLSALTAENGTLMPTWGAAGQVVKIDRVEGLVVIRVLPQRQAIPAFTVTAIASLEQLSSIKNANHLRLKGGLRDRHLVVAQLEEIELPDTMPRSSHPVSVYRSGIETIETTDTASSVMSSTGKLTRSNRSEGPGEAQ